MIGEDGAAATRAGCGCLASGPVGAELVRDVGSDPTNGRYADVTVHRCASCGQTWLRYQVEWEGFSGSGRWAKAPITEAAAGTIRAEEAAAYIDAAPWHLRGGSYWSGGPHKGTGPLRWGP